MPPDSRLPALVLLWKWLRNPIRVLEDCTERYGEAFTLRIPGIPRFVVFSNPDTVKQVFADDGETLLAGKFNAFIRVFLGESSVLLLDRKEHLRQRKLLLPPFHGERMHAYGQVMIDLSHDAIERFPSGAPFAVHPYLQEATLRVIIRTVIGLDEGPRYENLVAKIRQSLELGSWPPLLVPWMRVDLGPKSPWGRYKRAEAEVDDALLAIIRQRRAAVVPGEKAQERRSEGDLVSSFSPPLPVHSLSPTATQERSDILSLLLAARDDGGKPMTDAELRDELLTLLLAGHETTATALSWALRWVLGTPEVERTLRLEIDEAFATGEPTPERIARLPYLDAVVRETLRLQPVVPIVGRVLEKPMTLGGYDLPSGVGVACSIYLAHRRPQAYPNPTRFEPRRFLGSKFSPNEFFPFGGGVRRCIGMAFALYEMKMVLATLLSRVSMRLAPGVPVRVVRRAVTLAPSGGLPIVVDAKRDRRLARAA